MYRDELTGASQRIEQLQTRLDEQNQELAALRQQLVKRLELPPRSRRTRRRLLVSTVAGGAMIAWAALSSSPRQELSDVGGGRSELRVPVETPERVEQLASRCNKTVPRGSLRDLPRGTRLSSFATCLGCDCCAPRGASRAAAGECGRCPDDGSVLRALEKNGLTVVGGWPDEPLDSLHGLRFTLARPAEVFALLIGPSAISRIPELDREHVATVVAYDEMGRPIDAARATYPSWTRRDEARHEDYETRQRVLLVEACDGEKIARVHLGTEATNVRVLAIASLPSP